MPTLLHPSRLINRRPPHKKTRFAYKKTFPPVTRKRFLISGDFLKGFVEDVVLVAGDHQRRERQGDDHPNEAH